MDRIQITRPSQEELARLGIDSWPSWECEPSDFDWQYPDRETAYVFKGRAAVIAEDGQQAELGPGDLVVFPKGLKCRWKVTEQIEKVYRMG